MWKRKEEKDKYGKNSHLSAYNLYIVAMGYQYYYWTPSIY